MKRNFSFFKGVIIGTILFVLVFVLALYLVLKIQNHLALKMVEVEKRSILDEAQKNTIKTDQKNDLALFTTKKSPKSAYLEVQFICQAPLETLENWKYHEESCEEAALLQAYLYEKGSKISKPDAHLKILEMIDWQKKNMGCHHDLYADDMKKLAIGFYGLKEDEIKMIKDASIEDIKKEIASGHPVIVPITGDILKNPYYPYPGYHMLVVIGYTEDKIITNDNGTRRGKDFSYDIKTFEAAMKDAGGEVIVLKLK